jgi:hypothetical protein
VATISSKRARMRACSPWPIARRSVSVVRVEVVLLASDGAAGGDDRERLLRQLAPELEPALDREGRARVADHRVRVDDVRPARAVPVVAADVERERPHGVAIGSSAGLKGSSALDPSSPALKRP